MAWGKLITDKIFSFYDFRDSPPKHPFCEISLIQQFNVFSAFRQHLLWCEDLTQPWWIRTSASGWSECGWRAMLCKINHRHTWDSLELSENGMESVLLWRASDLEVKPHQSESVRANSQPSGLIPSHSSTFREGLEHYHWTSESCKSMSAQDLV